MLCVSPFSHESTAIAKAYRVQGYSERPIEATDKFLLPAGTVVGNRRDALLHDILGMPDKARELYEKDGYVESAAMVSIFEGNDEDAAKL